MQAVLSQASLGDGAQSVIVVIEEFVAGEIQNGHGVLSRNNCFAEETREKIRSARKGIGASNPCSPSIWESQKKWGAGTNSDLKKSEYYNTERSFNVLKESFCMVFHNRDTSLSSSLLTSL